MVFLLILEGDFLLVGFELVSCWKVMIVDMLLWVIDYLLGMVDMVVIFCVLDWFLVDVIY